MPTLEPTCFMLLSSCRYRKWDLGDGNAVIVRCEHDAVMHGPKGEEALLNIKTLNEWDSKVIFTQ